MSKSVIAIVFWKTTPELTETCINALSAMFPVTRTFKGFRDIRLVRSELDPNELALIQEWDSVEDHQDYMRFRTETGDLDKLLAMMVGHMQIHYWMQPSLAAATA